MGERSQASIGPRKTLAARVVQRQALACSRKQSMSGHNPRCWDCPVPSRLYLAAVVIDMLVLQVHARRGLCAASRILATRPTAPFLPNRYDLMKSNTETFCLVWLPCTRVMAIAADPPAQALDGRFSDLPKCCSDVRLTWRRRQTSRRFAPKPSRRPRARLSKKLW